MNRHLIIIGASGHGKVIADIALLTGGYEKISFLDDNDSLKTCMGFPVIGRSADLEKYIDQADFLVAIGNAEIRKRIQEQLCTQQAEIPVLIHPKAVVGVNCEFGEGTVVMAGTVINPETTIGRGCIINTCASVDHDCKLGDYVHVAVGAHIAGNVEISDGTWIGAGATISNNRKICSDCMIGAGAVVVKDLLESGTYVGVPAKRIS